MAPQAAQQTLSQILSGKITTEDDSKAVDAVLKTLVQIPSAENEDMIVKVITSPEQIRPATAQGVTQPATLRTSALELVKQNPSEGLILKLADYLVQKGAEPNDPVMDLLLQDNPAFLNAQLHLYQSEDITTENKNKLEQYFLNRCSQAVALMMGIPTGTEEYCRPATRGQCPSPAVERPGRRPRPPGPRRMRTLPPATPRKAKPAIMNAAHILPNCYGANRSQG